MNEKDKAVWYAAVDEWMTSSAGQDLGKFMFEKALTHRDDEAKVLVEALELERKRLDFITEFGSCWRVTYVKNGNKPVKYKMTDEGEYWGRWHNTPREAIDAALAAWEQGK